MRVTKEFKLAYPDKISVTTCKLPTSRVFETGKEENGMYFHFEVNNAEINNLKISRMSVFGKQHQILQWFLT